jgi:hypothetical protein
MKRLLFAITMLASVVGHIVNVKAEPVNAYPQMYKFMTDMASNPLTSARSYFNCDYTTKTCERGMAWRGYRVFEAISDADRTTILGHGACHSNPSGSSVCWNFDKGVYAGVINGGSREGNMTAEDTYNWPLPAW